MLEDVLRGISGSCTRSLLLAACSFTNVHQSSPFGQSLRTTDFLDDQLMWQRQYACGREADSTSVYYTWMVR